MRSAAIVCTKMANQKEWLYTRISCEDELFFYMQGKGCSELKKKTILNEHTITFNWFESLFPSCIWQMVSRPPTLSAAAVTEAASVSHLIIAAAVVVAQLFGAIAVWTAVLLITAFILKTAVCPLFTFMRTMLFIFAEIITSNVWTAVIQVLTSVHWTAF